VTMPLYRLTIALHRVLQNLIRARINDEMLY
jgi:hypothetical protein